MLKEPVSEVCLKEHVLENVIILRGESPSYKYK